MGRSYFRALTEETDRINNQESEHVFRSKFQRDRDRILYSKAFRRLSNKTQVFIAGFDDHMRTRLTHTLEVAQIADTIARKIGLNEVLVEAIAYGHDIGHTPFGHVGERSLNLIMNGCKDIYNFNDNLFEGERGFKHNYQSLRVATTLEDPARDKNGLNLTKYTLWGILNHSSKEYKKCNYYGVDGKCKLQNRNIPCHIRGKVTVDFYNESDLKDERDWTFEAVVVAVADEIAQRHHDIEDGIYAGILDKNNLVGKLCKKFNRVLSKEEKEELEKIKGLDLGMKSDNRSMIINRLSRLIVNLYTNQYIEHLESILSNIEKYFHIENSMDFYKNKGGIYHYLLERSKTNNIMDYLDFSKAFKEMDKKFRGYLYNHILYSELAQGMDGKADYIIRQLFKAYLSNPQQLPDKTIKTICYNFKDKTKDDKTLGGSRSFLKEKLDSPDESKRMQKIVLRVTCDYIAGMTDHYAMAQFEKLYGSQRFKNY